ncbi:MAG: amino acid adenylation domain-containing protein [Rhizonema sp. PD37]|nr:amino acid adenylation domain-containing protein [Rhizonema sp. PD37]
MQEIVIGSTDFDNNFSALTEQERHKILVEWNQTTVDYPRHLCIHQLFEAQVEKTPDNIAVVFNSQKLTYQELNHRANQLAHYLQSWGVGTEVLVGICVERSVEMVVGLLGILKAGGAYVPLDPTYPQERLSFVLADSQVQLLLTQQKFVARFTKSGVKTVCLDTDWELINQQSKNPSSSGVVPGNLAYVIYTSGSTGIPKGVLIQHQGVCNLAQAQVKLFDVQPHSRVLQFASMSFDASVWEIVMALCSGASLILGTQDSLRPGADLMRLLREHSITHVTLPPTALAALPIEELPNLQTLIVAGEACHPKLIAQWSKGRRFFNAYGPTESTVCATVAEYTSGDTQPFIGRPIANIRVYILDNYLQPVPIGTPGEIFIGGDGLARGYLNAAKLTEEKFIPNPFDNSKLYKTGDLAQFLPDGNIIFIGRVDHQVKIRGFRIELGEIEALLSQHPDVRQAVVIAREDIPGDQRLVAYIVFNQKQQAMPAVGFAYPTTLKRFLEEKLPVHMIPAVFVILDTLPLTPNGKVDRRNLPVPDRSRPDLEETFVAPSNAIEEKLAIIWAELLGLEQIGVNDHFLHLGGHSLIATQILSRVREEFTVELFFHQIFTNPTIAGLAQQIEQHSHLKQKWQHPAIQPIPREGMLPVSFAQERVHFIQEVAPESSAYQAQATLRFQGELDVAVLQKCLSEIVRRHEIFRTTFPTVNGRLFQVIHPAPQISFTVVEIQTFPEPARQAEVQRLFEVEVQKTFDLNQLPLVRWVLLKLSNHEHLLIHIEHHMVHDGWSFNKVFLSELVELYQAFCSGNPSPLTELPLQFVDYAHWQREWVNSQSAQTQLAYWQQQLSGSSPLLELPYDRPRPAEQTYNGAQIRVELPINLYESLQVLSRQEGSTLFMTMLAAFLVMLHRYTGLDDLCVGTAVANRRVCEVERLIGMIVNNLVLRTNLSGNPTFRELLGRVRSCTMEAFANEDLPFDKVVEVLKPVRNLSYNPLFQVMFSYHDTPLPNLSLPDLDISPNVALSNKSTKFDLDVVVIPNSQQYARDSGITVIWEYNTDLFDAATIQQMVEQYQTLLEGIIANPEQHLGELPLLTQAQQQLLAEWNQTHRNYPKDECIHQLFAAQVERSPNAIAVEQDGQQLTYRELSARANQLAHHLQSLGVKSETLVGICVDRSLEMIVGLLGILKAGAAYVPLDPAYPQERLDYILEDTQLDILLTQERFQNKLQNYNGKTICIDTDWSVIAQHSTSNPISDLQLHNQAYIIYTSGSTGKPKGVMIEHRSLMNFVITAIDEYGINAGERILQFASICFDTSIEEIFPSLLVGATLVLRTEQMLHSVDEFWCRCKDWQLTVLNFPTAYWHQLVAELLPQDSRIPECLKTVIVGGEEVQREIVLHWHSSVTHFPQLPQLFNGYGPTEATVTTTLQRLNSPAATSVSIGRPIGNAQVYILDQYLQRVPIGVLGELHIGGASLARGYWQRPSATAEKFIPNPIADATSSRLYKTGDLARFRANGTLEYLGRVDNQVKVRGFRIELGEIETVLRQHPQVLQAVVIARVDIPGQKRLVAYIVPRQLQPTTDELRHFLTSKLPNYMVPSAFVLLEALPMTPNQKVDYRALPTPDFSRNVEDKFVAPRTSIEEKLAAIWSEILKLEKVGIHDNFFELGGDSILSIQIISRANTAGIQIAPKQLFKYQTVAELAAVNGITRSVTAEQGLVTGSVILSPIQQWFFEQKLSEPDYFNQSVLLSVPPALTPEQLQQIVQQLLLHHDALRLQFVQLEEWQQMNAATLESVPLSIIDLSHLSREAQQTTMNAADAELQASLNLSTGSIVRVALFELGNNQPNRLLFIIHHLAVDGISWRILLEDLATAYQQISMGVAIKLPPKTTSFQYWSDRLTEYGQSEAITTELDYWSNECNFNVTSLPVDYPSTIEENSITSTDTVSFSLTEEQSRALLQDVPSAYNTQINDVLLTALVQSFAQWTGKLSLLIDLEGHGREDLFEDVDLSRTVGWFTTLFPVRLQIEKIDHPGEALKLVKEQLRRIPNRGIGYGVLRYLNEFPAIRTKLQMLPLAQVSFNYLGQFDRVLGASDMLGLAKELKAEQSLLNKRSHLLGVSGFIRAGKLEMTWTYSEKIHKRATIEYLALGFMEALRSLIVHCQAPETGDYTPSDFSATKLSQKQLDKLMAKINRNNKR